MTTVTNEILDQQIQRNRILSILAILLFLGGFIAAFYFFNEAKKAKQEVEDKNILLNKTLDSLQMTKETVITLRDSLNNLTLRVVVEQAPGDNSNVTEEEILKNLPNAIQQKKEVAIPERRAAITRLFTTGDSDAANDTRKAAQTELIKKYGNDPQMLGAMLDYALDGKVSLEYSSSLYRMIYIMTESSPSILLSQKDKIKKLVDEMAAANLIGSGTQKDVDAVYRKLKAMKK